MPELQPYMNFLQIFEGVPFIAYILFGLGVMLLMIEMSIPGFGVAGVGSMISFSASVILAADTLVEGLIFTGIILAVSAVIVVTFLVLLSKGVFKSGLILHASTSREAGYTSTAEDFSHLLHAEGSAETTLRPAGRALINGRTYDVVTDGNFIPAGEAIRVQEVVGSRIVVSADRT